jgi:Spy/CpxP family protein refolding chaperone
MKMKKAIAVLGLIAIMVVGTTYAYAAAQSYGSSPAPGRMGHGYWGYHRELSLTPEQRAKVQELRWKFNEETAQLRGAILTKRLELRSLWTDPKAESKAILEKARELRNLQDQLRDKNLQMGLEVRSILTPEQLSQIGTGYNFGRGSMMGRGDMMGQGGMMGYGYDEGRCG